MRKRRDLTGERFNRWNVVAFSHNKAPHDYYHCVCDCGTKKVVQGPSLLYGLTRSCGCLRVEVNKEIHAKHRFCNHPAYQSWVALNRRCYDLNFTGYKNYGGRGIIVCNKWKEFEGFWEDMGTTWERGRTVDRINGNGNYELGNCRWATPLEQSANLKTNKIINTPWGPLHQSEAARRGNVNLMTLRMRIVRGWPESTWFLPAGRNFNSK